jgi:hypothetical protein
MTISLCLIDHSMVLSQPPSLYTAPLILLKIIVSTKKVAGLTRRLNLFWDFREESACLYFYMLNLHVKTFWIMQQVVEK